jgi:hypothetical protein
MNPVAKAAIKRGAELMASDPRNAVFQIYTGNMLAAKDAHKVGDTPLYHRHLRTMATALLHGHNESGVHLHPEKQNDGLVFAAAAGDLRLAAQLAEIEPVTESSHDFDIALGDLLRATILDLPHAEHDYNPTTAESKLFRGLKEIGSESFTTEGIDAYWKETRNRRYANTLHQDDNLFAEAATQIHQHRIG